MNRIVFVLAMAAAPLACGDDSSAKPCTCTCTCADNSEHEVDVDSDTECDPACDSECGAGNVTGVASVCIE